MRLTSLGPFRRRNHVAHQIIKSPNDFPSHQGYAFFVFRIHLRPTKKGSSCFRSRLTKIQLCFRRFRTITVRDISNLRGLANPLNEADALSAAISIAEKTIKAEQDRTKTLERELASAAEQLGAMRSAYDEASSRAQHLESELSVALGRGKVHN